LQHFNLQQSTFGIEYASVTPVIHPQAVAVQNEESWHIISSDDSIAEIAEALSSTAAHIAFVLHQPVAALQNLEDAIIFFRCLSRSNAVKFLAQLAGTLSSQSFILSSMPGRAEDALAFIEEAVRIRRYVIERMPCCIVDYFPGLACCLVHMSSRLFDLGRFDEAVAPIREAVGNFVMLEESTPGAFRFEVEISKEIYAERVLAASSEDHDTNSQCD